MIDDSRGLIVYSIICLNRKKKDLIFFIKYFILSFDIDLQLK